MKRSPMKRSPIIRTAMRRHIKRLTAQDRRDYQTATENARNEDGFLVCQSCGRWMLDRDAQRHHRVFRSRLGTNEPSNIAVVCNACHGAFHGERVIER